jgi:Protein of unknown function (DUF2865)
VLDHRWQSSRCAGGLVAAGLALAALMFPATPASAQGFFESLFGRWSGPTAYADPYWNPFGPRPHDPRTETGGSLAYCVRLCDGRFFPIARHGGATPAQACSAFCPASQTKIYNGSSIEHAVGQDGKRYTELSTAFVYRETIVTGCSCNGKDAFGLVNIAVEEDATLRPGDVVATNAGLMAYNGRHRTANFTPIGSYSGLSGDLRRKLTETKTTPALERPAPVPRATQDEATGSIRSSRNKRVQSDR